DGVFLLSSVGGYVNAQGEEVAGFWTLTPALEAGRVREAYEGGLDTGDLVYHLAPWVFEGRMAGTHLGITPRFVRTFGWSFPKNSLVYLNGPCLALGAWTDALGAAGAGLV